VSRKLLFLFCFAELAPFPSLMDAQQTVLQGEDDIWVSTV
jgi:hypothetical protein